MKKDNARKNNSFVFNVLRSYFSEKKLLVAFVIICYVGLLAIGIANADELESKQLKLEKAKELDSSISLESLQELDKPKPSIYIIQELQGGGIIFKACSVREVVMLAHNYCKDDKKACKKAVLISAEQGDDELAPCLDKQSAYKNYIKLQGAN